MIEAPLYGVMAEFDNPTDLMKAARATYAAGYRNIDAYTPVSDRGTGRSDRLP